MLFTDITEIVSFVLEMLILSASMVVVFRSSQFSRPVAKGSVIFIFVCVVLELVLTIAELILVAKMWVDTFDPDFQQYTAGLVNSVFIITLLQHLFFLFLYSWQAHLARNCLRACDTHRRELAVLNRLKGQKISLRQINVASRVQKLFRPQPTQVPPKKLDSGFLEFDSETKLEPGDAGTDLLQPRRKSETFQLKDLSNRHIAKPSPQPSPAPAGEERANAEEPFEDVFNEKAPLEEEPEEFVDETFDKGAPSEDFLVFRGDFGEEADAKEAPKKDAGRVSEDESPEKGI